MSFQTLAVDAILFDMDGTLIDSTPGLIKAWEQFSKDYNLGDPQAVMHATHGRRLYDTLKDVCNINDEEKLLAEIDRFEEQVILGGPVVLPGVHSLLKSLPPDSWTIVTSVSMGEATSYYAPRALERCGISLPEAGIITSNDVANGKPHPDPYLAGARKCGVPPERCLVIEDAISGLQSGRNAGAKTLAVCTSTSRTTIQASNVHPDFIIADLSRVKIRKGTETSEAGSLEVIITVDGLDETEKQE